MFNVCSILSVFTIVPLMAVLGWHPMVGLAIGTLARRVRAGRCAMAGAARARASASVSTSRRATRASAKWSALMIPGTVGLAAVQVNQLVNVYLATGAGTGAVTYLGFAFRLMYLPIGLFGVSIATAVLPSIARHAVRRRSRPRSATTCRRRCG